MEALSMYILKLNLLLIAFYLLYKFVLERGTLFAENRFYFLICIALSLGLPLLYFTKITYISPLDLVVAQANKQLVPHSQNPTKSYIYLIALLIFLISISLLIRSINTVIKIKTSINKTVPLTKKGIKYYNQKQFLSPFSLWDSIYYNSENYSKSELQMILLHEEVHIRQRHSIDLIIIHFMCCLFWFNPLLWQLKKSMIKNLEFLTDQTVLSQTNDMILYQKTLLKAMGLPSSSSLIHSFNQSFLKTRIMKINQSKTPKSACWRFCIPLSGAVLFMFLFQTETVAQVRPSNPRTTTKILVNANKSGKGESVMLSHTEESDTAKTDSTKYIYKRKEIIIHSTHPIENAVEADFIEIDPNSEEGKRHLILNENSQIKSTETTNKNKVVILDNLEIVSQDEQALKDYQIALQESYKKIETAKEAFLEKRREAINASKVAMAESRKAAIESRMATLEENKRIMTEGKMMALEENRKAIEASKIAFEESRKAILENMLAVIETQKALLKAPTSER